MMMGDATGLLRRMSGCMVGLPAMADFNKVMVRGIICYAIAAFMFFSLVSWASSASITP
jgi:hypothetical protein